MAKLPQFKDFRKEDYKEAPEWFTRFLYLLNNFANAIYVAINKSLTFQENIRSLIKEVNFTTLATYSTGDFTAISFPNPLGVKPIGMTIQFISTADYIPIKKVEGQAVSWSEENNVITINYVSGLDDSEAYIIRVLVI